MNGARAVSSGEWVRAEALVLLAVQKQSAAQKYEEDWKVESVETSFSKVEAEAKPQEASNVLAKESKTVLSKAELTCSTGWPT